MTGRVLAARFFGGRPQDCLRSGWNVFDFLVVAASFTPGLRETRCCCGSPAWRACCGSCGCCPTCAC